MIGPMTTFSAVLTTGIYCRPGCSAHPKPSNVVPYTSPAAAEAAGFRACLRCRPYRTATPLEWSGPELVCRAVQLILDGALDDGTEVDLGRRIGVSPRHLRRLFAEHVGATPDQVARSRRAHFARRLLDDTDLTITDIAFASGFGSVRQFNRACSDIFRSTPGELRARRRKADRLVADGGLVLRLFHAGSLDWQAMLRYFAPRAIGGVEQIDFDTNGGTYRRTIEVDGDAGVIEVWQGGDDHLLLRAHLPHWEGLIHVVQRVRRLCNLDADVAPALEQLGTDPAVGPLVNTHPGLRTAGAWDPFEIGVRAIIGQQVSVAGASTLTGRLAAVTGTPVPGLTKFGLDRLFPSPEVLATADLTGVGLTTARAAAVRAFSTAVADGTLQLDRSQPLADLVSSIADIDGLGPWTAHYIALRLGEPDAFPDSDLGLRRAMGPPVPSASALRMAAEAWRPWRALAATHLWAAEAS